MIDSFLTIDDKTYLTEIVEKKSRFIAQLIKVESKAEAVSKIEEIRKEHRNARHNVYAYRIANDEEGVSDDGEPSGTAGVPLLDILRGEKLLNILVVVTRYFGGILLGTGGLVKAYSTSAKEAIKVAQRVKMKLCDEHEVKVDYCYHDILLHYFNKESLTIKDTIFLDKVCFYILTEKAKTKEILEKIFEKTERNVEVTLKGEYYHE